MRCVRIGYRGAVGVRPLRPLRATEEEKTALEDKIKLERGFRWDPALQRWKEEKRNVGKEFNASDMIIRTKTGDEYVVWPVVHAYLVEKDVKSVKCSEIEGLMKEGYTLLDVRLAKDFAESHAKGAINVPLFRPVTRDNAWNQAKKLAYLAMGMMPTERNTDFTQQVIEKIPEKSKVLVMCSRGGTLETVVIGPGENPKTCKDPDRAFGRETRSLKAIFELLQEGFTDVFYIEKGFGQWRYEGRDVESS